MHHENITLLGKGIAAMVSSGILYLADTATDVVIGVPEWVTKLGLPVAMLLLCVSGLVALFKALSAERDARIKDRDATISLYREDQKQAQDARQELITATRDQTNAFKNLEKSIEKALDKAK